MKRILCRREDHLGAHYLLQHRKLTHQIAIVIRLGKDARDALSLLVSTAAAARKVCIPNDA